MNKKNFGILLITVVVVTAASILAIFKISRDPYLFSRTKTYSGECYFGFETWNFVPDGSHDWWEIDNELKEFEGHVFPVPGNRPTGLSGARIIFEGRASRVGRFGHMGVCPRKIKVFKILKSEPVKFDLLEYQLIHRTN